MMSEEDLDEAVGDATNDLANTHMNGDIESEVGLNPGVTNKADVENKGVSADEPAPLNKETPPKEQNDQQKNENIQENGKNEQNITTAPQRGTEVRQHALQIQPTLNLSITIGSIVKITE